MSAGASGSVLVKAQVNNFANADFDLLSSLGRLTQTGTSYDLDLGNIVIGKSINAALQLDNDVAGPADFLRGSFDLAAADDFALHGYDKLAAKVLRLSMSLGRRLFAHHHLGQTMPVARVDKRKNAKITLLRHPAHQNDVPPDVRLSQFTASVTSF